MMLSRDILNLPSTLLLAWWAGAGCASRPVAEPPPSVDVSWANEQIDVQRIMKRRLLAADPIERAVEAHLTRDPRVEDARFAIVIANFGCDHSSADAFFSFATVVKSREPMTADDVLRLLRDA